MRNGRKSQTIKSKNKEDKSKEKLKKKEKKKTGNKMQCPPPQGMGHTLEDDALEKKSRKTSSPVVNRVGLTTNLEREKTDKPKHKAPSR